MVKEIQFKFGLSKTVKKLNIHIHVFIFIFVGVVVNS